MRADPDVAPGGRDRAAPHAAQLRVPERSELGARRLHTDGLGDRRRADARQGMADADGMPRGGPRHFAAVV